MTATVTRYHYINWISEINSVNVGCGVPIKIINCVHLHVIIKDMHHEAYHANDTSRHIASLIA